MRLIDADKCPCNDCIPPLSDSRDCHIFPCKEFSEWYGDTAYDVDAVVKAIHKYYQNKLDNTPTQEEEICSEKIYEIFGDNKAICEIVKRGGIDG